MRNYIISLLTVVVQLTVFIAANDSSAQLQINRFGQLDSLQATPKNVVVFIHTDWCKYCAQMEHSTFKNDSIVQMLNTHFYFVSLDAESEEDIYYHGRKFTFKPSGNHTGIHELARQLGSKDGKLNFPTICILNHKDEIIFHYAGFMSAEELLAVLREAANS